MSMADMDPSKTVSKTSIKTQAGKKMAPGPQRLLKEADVNAIYD